MKKGLIIKRIAFVIWIGLIMVVEIKYGLLAYVITILASAALGLSWICDWVLENEEDKRSK